MFPKKKAFQYVAIDYKILQKFLKYLKGFQMLHHYLRNLKIFPLLFHTVH